MCSNALAAEIKLLHNPFDSKSLPQPGQLMTLQFLLPETKDLSYKVRALVVLDGEALDMTLDGVLDEKDRTIYKTEIRAPLVDLSYQFFIQSNGGKVTTTKKYKVARDCLPDTDIIDVEMPADLSAVESARFMVKRTRELERDIQSYNRSIEILKAIQENTR